MCPQLYLKPTASNRHAFTESVTIGCEFFNVVWPCWNMLSLCVDDNFIFDT